MSLVARLVAGARELSFEGPLGHLLHHAASHVPHWHWHGRWHWHGQGAEGAPDPRRRIAFTIAVIALGAKMARADGAVTDAEVAAFREVFQVPHGEEEHVRIVFDLARKSTHGFDTYARQVGRMFHEDRGVLEDLLGGLFHIALADGELRPAEDEYLREVAHHFGFDGADYDRLRAVFTGEHESDPYTVLGVAPNAAPEDIRAAYHRLMRETHPDLLLGRGLPPECIRLATARVARINAAYDLIYRRGLQPA
jgi:DnaJ like chaperone protein